MPDVTEDEGEDNISKNPQSTNNQSNKSNQEASTPTSNTTAVNSCDPAVGEGQSSSETVEDNSNNSSSPHPTPPQPATADTSSRRTQGGHFFDIEFYISHNLINIHLFNILKYFFTMHFKVRHKLSL